MSQIDDKKLLASLIKNLKGSGYTTYSVILSQSKVSFDNGEISPGGYTTPSGIVLNRNLNMAELSLVARHEMLHSLLRHTDEKTWKSHQTDHLIRNMAGDLELSHYYDVTDSAIFNAGGALSQGLNVYRRNNSNFYNKGCNEAYDMIAKSQNDKQPMKGSALGDCIQPDEQPGASVANQPGKKVDVSEATADKLNELLKGVKSDSQQIYNQAKNIKKLRQASKVDPELDLFYDLNRYFIWAQRLNRSRSFVRPNKKYGDDIIKKGVTRSVRPSKTLAVYVDRSGSMSADKTDKAENILTNTLRKLKNVEVIVKYFADSVSDTGDITGGTNYSAIINHINDNKFRDVAIITDNDFDGQNNIADVDAVWLVSVQSGYATNLKERFNATKMKEVIL